jgi:hypothetical protein
VNTDTRSSSSFALYSLIRVTDGVVFKAYGDTTFTFYSTTDYGTTTNALTWDTNSLSVGTVNAAGLVLMQQRDSWSDYVSASTAIPVIKAIQNNDYILTVTYAGTTLTVASSYSIPCTQALPAGAVCNNMHLTLDPSLMDFGRNMLVVVSPIDCSAVTDVTSISGPSVRFYAMDTVADIDVTPADAIVDST